MADIEITVKGHKCERCGHEWISKSKKRKVPILCPKCKSAYWNIPKKQQEKTEEKIEE